MQTKLGTHMDAKILLGPGHHTAQTRNRKTSVMD